MPRQSKHGRRVEREDSPEQTKKQEREENHRFLTPDTFCPFQAIFPLLLSLFFT